MSHVSAATHDWISSMSTWSPPAVSARSVTSCTRTNSRASAPSRVVISSRSSRTIHARSTSRSVPSSATASGRPAGRRAVMGVSRSRPASSKALRSTSTSMPAVCRNPAITSRKGASKNSSGFSSGLSSTSSIAVSGLGLTGSRLDVSRKSSCRGAASSPAAAAAPAPAAPPGWSPARLTSTRVIRPSTISTCRTSGSAPSNCTLTFPVPAGTRNRPSLAPSGLPSSVTCAPGGSVFT